MYSSYHTIRLEKAARKWDDGLPIGNGRIGAMIMGKVNEETIFVNEETLWFGPLRKRTNPDGREQVGKIRELLLKGEVEEAAFLSKMAMTSTPKYNNPFQPAGDLRLCFMRHQGKASNYSRELDLDQALGKVFYTIDGADYQREHLISSSYNVMAIRLTTNHPQGITISANMSRKPFEEFTGKIAQETVGNWGRNGDQGVHYLTGVRLKAVPLENENAEHFEEGCMGDFVYAKNAKEVVIYLTTGTDFAEIQQAMEEDRDYDFGPCTKHCPDFLLERINQTLTNAVEAGYEKIKKVHVEEYQALYHRFSLEINTDEVSPEAAGEAIKKSDDLTGKESIGNPIRDSYGNFFMETLMEEIRSGSGKRMAELTQLLVNYARYLMIASSYRCLLPSNLQGLWNGSYEPPWQSQYTININTEMNYWFVEKANLSECHLPLFEHVKRMLPNGRQTAKDLYGCEGFCAHHNTNLWGCTDLEGIFDASPFWPMGAAWLSLHLYEHYAFTKDKEFLTQTAMPIMREAIRFFEGYLYETPEGLLLTGPSLSPENTYRSEAGQKGALCMAPTMDSSILRALLTDYLEGLAVLKEETSKDFLMLTEMRDKLVPLQIGSDGRILEWYQEYEETEPGHRHISHMFALHPGFEITEDTKVLFEAAKRTIDFRLEHGGGHTGWSKAWLCCFMARLKRPEDFYNNLFQMMQKCIQDNLLDVHPPFQIDGNFGFAEAVIEGIVQSHAGYIELLPALPKEWRSGSLKGVVLRGGTKADITWENGTLTKCVLTSIEETELELRYKGKKQIVLLKKDSQVEKLFD